MIAWHSVRDKLQVEKRESCRTVGSGLDFCRDFDRPPAGITYFDLDPVIVADREIDSSRERVPVRSAGSELFSGRQTARQGIWNALTPSIGVGPWLFMLCFHYEWSLLHDSALSSWLYTCICLPG
jgi:hypothetical protein